VAPALRGLGVAPRNVLPQSGRGASITRNRKRGATIAYSDSQAAVTRFTVLRPVRGYRVGRRCQLKRPRHSKGKPRRCTLYRAVGSFSHRDRIGANRLHFTGRVNRTPLRVGSYRLSAVARNAAGQSSAARVTSFRIIR